jgi:NAD-dependent deacetylase
VYEIHGSVHENACMDCGAVYPLQAVLEAEGIPRCQKCGGVIKPSVVLYGEAPDKYVCMGACREISNADTLIVAGTSLSVEPAASFLEYFSGKNLVVINREPTPADEKANLVLRVDVAEILGALD